MKFRGRTDFRDYASGLAFHLPHSHEVNSNIRNLQDFYGVDFRDNKPLEMLQQQNILPVNAIRTIFTGSRAGEHNTFFDAWKSYTAHLVKATGVTEYVLFNRGLEPIFSLPTLVEEIQQVTNAQLCRVVHPSHWSKKANWIHVFENDKDESRKILQTVFH
eukprot:m.11915 g.11915  ORF g.11915 m.11915 type:complete len:160 (+) comp7884_c0_seq1:557-1036(+)